MFDTREGVSKCLCKHICTLGEQALSLARCGSVRSRKSMFGDKCCAEKENMVASGVGKCSEGQRGDSENLSEISTTILRILITLQAFTGTEST